MPSPCSVNRKDHETCNYKVYNTSEYGVIESLGEGSSFTRDFDNVYNGCEIADEKDGGEVPANYGDRLGD